MTKIVLRVTSAVMLVIAAIYLWYVFTHPEFGSVFYIGKLEIGPTIWKVFYCLYAAAMVGCFIGSFFVKSKN